MEQNTAQVRVSVIIPVYNCEKYVEEAVASVLNQPYKNIDIILVDDGSKDNSPALCDQFAAAHDRVRVIHQENAGVSAARNAGIEAVLASISGDFYKNHYVAFLDADDLWAPDFFSPETQALLSHNPNVDLIGFQSCHCNHNATRCDYPHTMESGIFSGSAKNVYKHSKQHFAAMLYSCRLLHTYQISFVPKLKCCEDKIFHMQCIYLANSVLLHNTLMYYYRRTPGSAVHKRDYGISYFRPIIDGWVRSDAIMNQWHNDARGILREGTALAAVHIVDMHEEHYQQFRPKRELEQMMREHPEYLELITSDFAFNRPDSGLRWQEMQTHPVTFRLRCYTKGFITVLAHKIYALLYRIPPIARIIDKKRYLVPMDKQQTKG